MTAVRRVLCVDDDEDDREMVSLALQEIDPTIILIHAENGKDAHNFLLEAKLQHQLPGLIILDINMPKMDGKETLIEIRKDADLNRIPVAMYTTSSSEMDKAFCRLHNVTMVTKPPAYQMVVKEMSRLLKACSTN